MSNENDYGMKILKQALEELKAMTSQEFIDYHDEFVRRNQESQEFPDSPEEQK